MVSIILSLSHSVEGNRELNHGRMHQINRIKHTFLTLDLYHYWLTACLEVTISLIVSDSVLI